MESSVKSWSPLRCTGWIAAGIFLGGWSGEILKDGSPRTYESAGLVSGNDRPGDSAQLSLTNARKILAELEAENFRGPWKDDPAKLRDVVRIEAVPGGTRLSVVTSKPHHSQFIAYRLAKLFRNIPYEKSLDSRPGAPDPTDAQRSMIADYRKLENLLVAQAAKAGFIDFREVVPLALRGSDKAGKLMGDEDFSRRFSRYEEISIQLGSEGFIEEDFSSAGVLEWPEYPENGTRPEAVDRAVAISPYAGLLLGCCGAVLFGKSRRRAPADAAPPPTTEAAATSGGPSDW